MANNFDSSDKVTQNQLDISDEFLIMPTTKLDADQYAAEDIDGVTESLFGSGNVAFGVLQASILEDGGSDATTPIFDSGNIFSNLGNGQLSAVNFGDYTPSVKSFTDPTAQADSRIMTTSGNNYDGGEAFVTSGNDGNFSAGTVGSLSASQLSSDAGTFSSSGSGLSLGSGLNGSNGQSGLNGNSGTNGTNGSSNNGNDGTDGTDGTNGNGDCDKTIINVDIGDTIINFGDINIDLGDLTEIIDGLFIDLGDTITTLIAEINNTVNILGDIITNIDILDLSNVTVLVTNITNNLTDIVNNTVTEISDITTNITNIINNILDGGDLGDLNLLLDLNLLDTVITDVNVPIYDILGTDVNLDIDLNPAYNLVTEIANLTGLDILSDTLGELGGVVESLQGTIDQVTDIVTDLDLRNPDATIDQLVDTLTNLNDNVSGITDQVDDAVGDILDTIGLGGDGNNDEGLVSQTLDPLVQDVGNVLDDLTGDATADLTHDLDGAVDSVTDIVDDLTGGITGGLLGGNNNNQDGNGDSDITADLGLEPLNIDETVEVALDPVEDLIGDVDLGIVADTDLFNGNGNEIDNNAGDTDITVDAGIDLIDNTILEEGLDIPLDPVEQITGDIDLDVDLATDLLNDLADPLVNNGEGGTGEDTLLAGIGDGLNEVVGSTLDGDSEGVVEGLLGLGDLGGDIGGEGIVSQTLDPIVEGVGDILDDATGGATQELSDGLEQTVDAVTDVADDLIGGITGGLDDAAESLMDGDAEGAVEDILGLADLGGDIGEGDDGLISQTLDPVVEDVGDILDDATGGATQELSDGLEQAVDGVTDLADDLTGGITAGLLGENNNNQDGSGDSDLTSNLDIDPLGINDDLEVALDPVEDLAGDVDANLDIVTNLLDSSDSDNDAGDTDVTAQPDIELMDTELLGGDAEIELDLVEEIIGDTDLNLDVATDVLGDIADPLVNDAEGGTGEDTLLSHLGDGLSDIAEELIPGLNAGDAADEDLTLDSNIDILDENLADTDLGSVLDPVEDIAGDIDTGIDLGTDILGDSETSNHAGDTDLEVDLDIDVAGIDLIDKPIDVNLDPVESLVGDIDLDVDSALDLLNGDGLGFGDFGNNCGDDNWTETTIGDGGLFGDLVDGLGGTGDVLPEPSGTVAEGLGVMDVEPEIDIGSLGGLFG